jgi:hypothetical protein
MIIACLTPAWGQRGLPGNSYYYVANARLPDAFLALRTHPSSQTGLRVTTMPIGLSARHIRDADHEQRERAN